MIFKSRNVCRTQADRGVSSEPQTCQMGVVAGHLKTGGNQALGTTSHISCARPSPMAPKGRPQSEAKPNAHKLGCVCCGTPDAILGGHVRPRLRMCPPSSSDLGHGIAQVLVRVERKGKEYGQRGGSNGEDEADRRGIRMHRHRRRAAKVRKGTRRSGSAEPVAYAARELCLRRRHRRHCPSGRWSQQKASLSALEPFGVRHFCFRPRSPVSGLRSPLVP